MENTELELLLLKNRLNFHWSKISKTWLLTNQSNRGDMQERFRSHPAESMEAAQADAITFIQAMHRSESRKEESIELETLLSKYRLTFNWGDPGLKWWLVGQNKGSNVLRRTVPQPAKDIETAKADAVKYILAMYQSSNKEIDI
ncbi:MAG: hypothetical protein M1281_16050 [Chloroflexi bacterium]|nr:hypothetical protein [Chloroflexota bacterium]